MSHGYNGNRLLIPLLEQDHIQGNPNAAVVLVEYGDSVDRKFRRKGVVSGQKLMKTSHDNLPDSIISYPSSDR